MRLSSGVVWRHRELDRFRAECPGGDPLLQRLLFERLDDDLRWLESLGAPVVERETGNELTAGVRFDPERLTAALAEAAGDVRLVDPAAPAAGLGAGDPRHRRLRRRPRAAARARDARGRPRARARGAGLHRRRPADWARSRSAPQCRPGRRLRSRDAGAARPRGPSRLRDPFAALRAPRRGDQRARRALRDRDLVGGRHGAVDGAPAARPRLVSGPRGGARASACASAAWGRWSRPRRRPGRRCGASRGT